LIARVYRLFRCANDRYWQIVLQKSFEHLREKHWFKIKREHATTIQKNRRADSIVSIFNFTEPTRRLLQHNRTKATSGHVRFPAALGA
jgi:hypothetical protein